MCFLLQSLLVVGASATTILTIFGLHAPFWVGIVVGFVFFGVAWFIYGIYQARNPDWWPPWDEGLPQAMRMTNVFVPSIMVFVMLIILIPVFQKAKQKGDIKRQRAIARQHMINQQNQNEARPIASMPAPPIPAKVIQKPVVQSESTMTKPTPSSQGKPTPQ